MAKKFNAKLFMNQLKRAEKKWVAVFGGCIVAAIGLLAYWIYNLAQIPVVFGA